MIGTDICNPKRIEQAFKRFGAKFLRRIFTSKEIEEINQLSSSKANFYQRIAGRFAAKEAVAKALETGIGGELSFQDFEIIKSSSGAPKVICNNKALTLLGNKGYKDIKVSISHEETLALAFAIAIN